MIITLIKYAAMLFSSTYMTYRILNMNRTFTRKSKFLFCFLFFMEVCIASLLRRSMFFISIMVITALCTIVHKIMYKAELNVTITATIISLGISYLLNLISILILYIPNVLGIEQFQTVDTFNAAVIGIIQIGLTFSIFHIKRLKHGLPFISNPEYRDLGTHISLTALILTSLLGIRTNTDYIPAILTYCMLICCLLLWFWIKSHMKLKYLEQVQKRETTELKETITHLNEEIFWLKKENETFSKIIHKDNKLLPAMELSVKESLFAMAGKDTLQERTESVENVLKQLDSLSQERAGIIKNYEPTRQELPEIGIPVLDMLFSFMAQKAVCLGAEFVLCPDDTIGKTIMEVISEKDASTLLADLIENALIAVKELQGEKRVLVELSTKDGCLYIGIKDNGAPFPDEVIQNWGIRRITTHAETGGSGIGMMSTHEICKRYLASFSIAYLDADLLYTKCVSVCFDGNHKQLFQINSGADRINCSACGALAPSAVTCDNFHLRASAHPAGGFLPYGNAVSYKTKTPAKSTTCDCT